MRREGLQNRSIGFLHVFLKKEPDMDTIMGLLKAKVFGLSCLTFVLFSCNMQPPEGQANEEVKQEDIVGLVEDVLSQEEQDALTPDMVIQSFKEGNDRFMRNDLTARNHSEQVRKSTYAQYPKAIVLSCVDSRVPVEDVFDRGIGDIFVARVAGNFVNEDILGSMEFACKVSGSKLILVMGHEHCGAVKAAVDDVKLGNITPMLSKIRPAVESVEYEGERTSGNAEFVHMACESNVRNTLEKIRVESPILKEMEEKEQIKILGAIYDMDSGKVTFL
jgi:carbonic anhydrase